MITLELITSMLNDLNDLLMPGLRKIFIEVDFNKRFSLRYMYRGL